MDLAVELLVVLLPPVLVLRGSAHHVLLLQEHYLQVVELVSHRVLLPPLYQLLF